jgi:ferrous iron transport protein B
MHFQTKDLEEIFAEERIAFAKGAVTETVQHPPEPKETLTQKIDKILIHPLLGLPIFLILMWLLFQLTFTVGSVPMEWIGMFFEALAGGVKHLLGNNELSKIIADGALAGVGAIVMFLPNIVILFFGIAEGKFSRHSGYAVRQVVIHSHVIRLDPCVARHGRFSLVVRIVGFNISLDANV